MVRDLNCGLTSFSIVLLGIRGPVDVLVLPDLRDNGGDLCHVPGVRHEQDPVVELSAEEAAANGRHSAGRDRGRGL